MKHRILPVVVLALLTPAAAAQTLLASFEGNTASDFMSLVVGGHDLDGDLAADVVVGMAMDDTNGANAGIVIAYSGKTGATLWTRTGGSALDLFGWSLAMSPDVNGDGVADVVVGAPAEEFLFGARPGAVRVLSGATGTTLRTVFGEADGDWMGYSVAAGFDYDEDGNYDFAGGAPFHDGSGKTNTGAAEIWSGSSGLSLFEVPFTEEGGRGGHSMTGVDGDTYKLAVGAPYHDGAGSESGLVCVVTDFGIAPFNMIGGNGDHFGWSLAWVQANADPFYELLVGVPGGGSSQGLIFLYEGNTPVWIWGGLSGDEYGTSLASIGDLDGDGIDEFAVGAPQPGSGAGYVEVLTPFGAPLITLTGSSVGDEFGSNVAAAGDVNLDGSLDLAVGARLFDGAAGTYTGRVELHSTCANFLNYCPSGLSASGCNAVILAAGLPSASEGSGFSLLAWNVEGLKDGTFFYGSNGRQQSPWGNGSSYQCVAPPVQRAGVLTGGGLPGMCNGSFAQDLNELWDSNPGKDPGAGATVQAQLWYRDPQNTSNQTTSLSNAIEFVVCS